MFKIPIPDNNSINLYPVWLSLYTTLKVSEHAIFQVRSFFFCYMAQQPVVGQGLLIIEASRSHSDTPHSAGLLWTSDKPDAETYT
jgi:hypothetical protein